MWHHAAMRILNAAAGNGYVEQLRTGDMSVGVYALPAGAVDGQSPHAEDEIYVVCKGKARIVTPGGTADLEPGTIIYVPAGEEHRFTDITDDLVLAVVFAPPEESRR